MEEFFVIWKSVEFYYFPLFVSTAWMRKSLFIKEPTIENSQFLAREIKIAHSFFSEQKCKDLSERWQFIIAVYAAEEK